MLASIVGREIEISRLVGKGKLSQNKEQRDIQGAARSFHALGRHKVADEMLA